MLPPFFRPLPMDDALIAFAANAIREYLRQRPESADTLEGVHNWWIRWPGIPESPAVTGIALERLEASGEVERVRIGGRMLWRRRQAADD